MRKTLIAATLFLLLTPLAAFAQAQPQPDAAHASADAVPTYSMTDIRLTGGY